MLLGSMLTQLSTASTNWSPSTPEEIFSHFILQLVANFVRLPVFYACLLTDWTKVEKENQNNELKDATLYW